jgi:hypothetical protein
MRLRRCLTAALLAASCIASMPAPGALAAKPGPSIKSVKVYSAGIDTQFGLCKFNAVVRYTKGAGDGLFLQLRRDGEVINSNFESVAAMSGRLAIDLATGLSLSPGSSYDFVAHLVDPMSGTSLSSATTSAFVSDGDCPAAGTLVTSYPAK